MRNIINILSGFWRASECGQDGQSPSTGTPSRTQISSEDVFSVPELFEMILRSLDVCDLLRVQQVAHSWFAAIQNSQKLQRKLCLLPEEHCNFYMLFESYRNRLPGLHSARPRCSLPPHQADSGNHLDFYIDISPPFVKKLGYRPSSDPKPIEVGSRCRQMLICQPPLRTMGVFPDCCRSTGIFSFDRHKSSQLPIETITAKDGVGITIGEVIEVYERISARHKLCPDASIVDHDELGFVRSRVTLYAKLELDDQDPTLLKYKNETERRARSKLEGDALDTRMQPYIAAKRTAQSNGQPIPTLAEYEASLTDGDGENT